MVLGSSNISFDMNNDFFVLQSPGTINQFTQTILTLCNNNDDNNYTPTTMIITCLPLQVEVVGVYETKVKKCFLRVLTLGNFGLGMGEWKNQNCGIDLESIDAKFGVCWTIFSFFTKCCFQNQFLAQINAFQIGFDFWSVWSFFIFPHFFK